MATYDWKQPLNNRPTYGPTVSNAQSISPTPQEKLSILQNYKNKKKKNLFETDNEPSIMQNTSVRSFEPPKTQETSLGDSKDTTFSKLSSDAFYKPFKEEKTKFNSFTRFQQPKPITFPKLQSGFKTIKPPQQASWDIEENENEQKKTPPNYFNSNSLDNSEEKNETKKQETKKYSEPKQLSFYSDYLKRQKNLYDDTNKRVTASNPYKQYNPQPIQASKLTDKEFYEKIPIKSWKDDFGNMIKEQQSTNSNEKNYATSSIKTARNHQEEIVDKYHSLLPSRKQIIDKKINELDETFNDKNNLNAGGQKMFDFMDSLNKEHTISNKLKSFGDFVEESRKKYPNVAKVEQPIVSSEAEQTPKLEGKQEEQQKRKVWAREDIVLDENDKKLSLPNQDKLIDEKLKWHNANDNKERKTAEEQGKQIRESDKITPDNFSGYSPETQMEYIKDITQKTNIKLDEKDMSYLSDFLSNDQALNLNQKGDMIKVLQKFLLQMGFSDINKATGNYSEKTRASIASIVELVTGNKNSGTKIGKDEKAKIVQLLSEVADGDSTIAGKLQDKFDENFNQARFDEVTGKNKVEEKKDGNPEKDKSHVDNSRFPNTSISKYTKNNSVSLTSTDIEKGVKITTINNKEYINATEVINSLFYNSSLEAEKHKGDLNWFKSKVNHNAPWDIKREKIWNDTLGITYPGAVDKPIVLFDELVTPEELGNIMYGYTGSAAGISEEVLIGGSMLAADPLKLITDKSVRDNEYKDHSAIRQGINWYIKGR